MVHGSPYTKFRTLPGVKHPKVRAWLGRHSRFHFHFTPTSASWLNAVEGFFAKLTRQRLKRGVFNRIVRKTNDDPKPFTWTADPASSPAASPRSASSDDSRCVSARPGFVTKL